MLGKTEGKRRRGATEDEMVGWHHPLNGHEFEQTAEDGKGQESLACCSPRGMAMTMFLSWWKETQHHVGCEEHGVAHPLQNLEGLLLLVLECLHILLCSFELGKTVLSPIASASSCIAEFTEPSRSHCLGLHTKKSHDMVERK